jgi:AcrR family transcriptional regulator
MPLANPATRKPGRPVNPARAAARREEILAAATQVFASCGFAGTDVQAIADLLGLGKGTLYRHFKSKRDLFLAAVDRGMQHMDERMREATAAVEDPLERLGRAVRAYLAFFDEHPELVELIMQERAVFRDRKKPTYFVHQENNIKPWIELVERMIADGQVRDVPPRRIADILTALLYGAMFTNYFLGAQKSFRTQTEEIMDIVLNGILTPTFSCGEIPPRNGTPQ